MDKFVWAGFDKGKWIFVVDVVQIGGVEMFHMLYAVIV